MIVIDKIKNVVKPVLDYGERCFKIDLRYILKGGSWLTVGNIISSFAYFLLSLLFASILSKDDVGNYRYVLTLSGLVFTLSLTGMNGGIIQAVSRGYEGVFKKAVKMQLLWGIIPAFITIIISIYYLLNRNYFLGITLFIAAIFSPFINSFNLYAAYLNGKKKFKEMSLYSVIIAIVSSLFLALALFFKLKLELIVLIFFTSNAIGAWLSYKITQIKESPNNNIDESAIKYGKHVSIMNIFISGAQYLDGIIVFHYLGASSLAIYYFATLIPNYSRDIFKIIPTLAIPKFSIRTYDEIRLTIKRKLILFLGVVFLFIIGYIIIIPELFKIFFPKYLDAVPYAQVAGVSILFVISFFSVSILNAHLLTKKLYIFNVISSFVRVVFVFIGVHFFGLWGVVWAVVAYSGFYGLYSLSLVLKNNT